MDRGKEDKFEITELFLVKADKNRTFIGCINRHTDENGNKFVTGSVVVNDGQICSKATTDYELGQQLDDIAILKLDYGLHEKCGVASTFFGNPFSLN
jgi:hypothetical protein